MTDFHDVYQMEHIQDPTSLLVYVQTAETITVQDSTPESKHLVERLDEEILTAPAEYVQYQRLIPNSTSTTVYRNGEYINSFSYGTSQVNFADNELNLKISETFTTRHSVVITFAERMYLERLAFVAKSSAIHVQDQEIKYVEVPEVVIYIVQCDEQTAQIDSCFEDVVLLKPLENGQEFVRSNEDKMSQHSLVTLEEYDIITQNSLITQKVDNAVHNDVIHNLTTHDVGVDRSDKILHDNVAPSELHISDDEMSMSHEHVENQFRDEEEENRSDQYAVHLALKKDNKSQREYELQQPAVAIHAQHLSNTTAIRAPVRNTTHLSQNDSDINKLAIVIADGTSPAFPTGTEFSAESAENQLSIVQVAEETQTTVEMESSESVTAFAQLHRGETEDNTDASHDDQFAQHLVVSKQGISNLHLQQTDLEISGFSSLTQTTRAPVKNRISTTEAESLPDGDVAVLKEIMPSVDNKFMEIGDEVVRITVNDDVEGITNKRQDAKESVDGSTFEEWSSSQIVTNTTLLVTETRIDQTDTQNSIDVTTSENADDDIETDTIRLALADGEIIEVARNSQGQSSNVAGSDNEWFDSDSETFSSELRLDSWPADWLAIYVEMLESDPTSDTSVNDNEETLPDGTTVRNRQQITTELRSVLQRLVMLGAYGEGGMKTVYKKYADRTRSTAAESDEDVQWEESTHDTGVVEKTRTSRQMKRVLVHERRVLSGVDFDQKLLEDRELLAAH